jgi:hypothetical protein
MLVVVPARVGFPTQVLIGLNADLKRREAIESDLTELPQMFFVPITATLLDFVIGAAFAPMLICANSSLESSRESAESARRDISHLGTRKGLLQWQVPDPMPKIATELGAGRLSQPFSEN